MAVLWESFLCFLLHLFILQAESLGKHFVDVKSTLQNCVPPSQAASPFSGITAAYFWGDSAGQSPIPAELPYPFFFIRIAF
jgi:hypothetical protein